MSARARAICSSYKGRQQQLSGVWRHGKPLPGVWEHLITHLGERGDLCTLICAQMYTHTHKLWELISGTQHTHTHTHVRAHHISWRNIQNIHDSFLPPPSPLTLTLSLLPSFCRHIKSERKGGRKRRGGRRKKGSRVAQGSGGISTEVDIPSAGCGCRQRYR